MPRKLAALCAVVILGCACIPRQEQPLLTEFRDERLVRRIRKAGRMVVAIDQRSAPFGKAIPSSGRLQGFNVDMGEVLARALGVKAQFVPLGGEDLRRLERGEATDFDADVIFPLEPITEAAARKNTFSDVYFVAHQRLLTPRGSEIDRIGDLSGRSVCMVDGKTSLPVEEVVAEVDVVEAGDAERCLPAVAGGRVDAVTATEIVLLDMAASRSGLEITGEELTTEGYGAVVDFGATGFADFVSEALLEAVEDGRWADSYRRWIAPHTRARSEPPDLTAEEAASLFPAGIPVAGSRPTASGG